MAERTGCPALLNLWSYVRKLKKSVPLNRVASCLYKNEKDGAMEALAQHGSVGGEQEQAV